jgi:hypothetical protein
MSADVVTLDERDPGARFSREAGSERPGDTPSDHRDPDVARVHEVRTLTLGGMPFDQAQR